MHQNDEIEYFSSTLVNPQRILYEELARDYLLYFGNKKPSKNQLLVLKELLVDAISSRLLTFPEKLTLQEMKCLYLAFKGKSISSAAQILELHPDTIKYYRKRCIKKLGCKNMVEAAFRSTSSHFQMYLCDKLINEHIKHIKSFYSKQK